MRKTITIPTINPATNVGNLNVSSSLNNNQSSAINKLSKNCADILTLPTYHNKNDISLLLYKQTANNLNSFFHKFEQMLLFGIAPSGRFPRGHVFSRNGEELGYILH